MLKNCFLLQHLIHLFICDFTFILYAIAIKFPLFENLGLFICSDAVGFCNWIHYLRWLPFLNAIFQNKFEFWLIHVSSNYVFVQCSRSLTQMRFFFSKNSNHCTEHQTWLLHIWNSISLTANNLRVGGAADTLAENFQVKIVRWKYWHHRWRLHRNVTFSQNWVLESCVLIIKWSNGNEWEQGFQFFLTDAYMYFRYYCLE